MFRPRILWAVLAALAVMPLAGCAQRRCCSPTVAYAAPVAAPCSNCGSTSSAPPLVVGP